MKLLILFALTLVFRFFPHPLELPIKRGHSFLTQKSPLTWIWVNKSGGQAVYKVLGL